MPSVISSLHPRSPIVAEHAPESYEVEVAVVEPRPKKRSREDDSDSDSNWSVTSPTSRDARKRSAMANATITKPRKRRIDDDEGAARYRLFTEENIAFVVSRLHELVRAETNKSQYKAERKENPSEEPAYTRKTAKQTASNLILRLFGAAPTENRFRFLNGRIVIGAGKGASDAKVESIRQDCRVAFLLPLNRDELNKILELFIEDCKNKFAKQELEAIKQKALDWWMNAKKVIEIC